MKIVSKTDQELIVAGHSWVTVIMGVCFALGGALGLGYVGLNYQSLSFQQAIVPGIFLGVGLILLAVSSFVNVTFNKGLSKINWVSKGLFGKKTQEYDLNQIKRVEVRDSYQVMRQSNNNSLTLAQPQLVRRLFLVTKDGQDLALSNQSSGTNSVSFNGLPVFQKPSSEIKVGQQIAEFLKVPFQEINPNGSTSEGNQTAAIITN